MAKLNPYLQFDGDARAAMEFYRDVFGGELTMNTFGEFGMQDGEHGASADGIMHAQLTTDLDFTLMASDLPPGMPAGTPNGHISLSGDEADALNGYFEKLADGGTVDVPLEKQVWGDHFGQVKDRYGVNWLVNIAG
jgi:PhnB protein